MMQLSRCFTPTVFAIMTIIAAALPPVAPHYHSGLRSDFMRPAHGAITKYSDDTLRAIDLVRMPLTRCETVTLCVLRADQPPSLLPV